MRSINLYVLSRDVEPDVEALYEKSLSHRKESLKFRFEELEMIRYIVDELTKQGVERNLFDGWVYSFTIPQIGKEFDLLRIGENKVTVNLELKSQPVSEERIAKQLKQNQHYLSRVADTIYSFTLMQKNSNEYALYYYDGSLRKATFTELILRLKEVINPVRDNVEALFKPRDYLISPLHTPRDFLDDKYYLNNQQETIKKEIVKGIERGLFGFYGSAGTGKTLLLYDLAKTLCKTNRVCVIHCGFLSDGHHYLNRHLDGVTIVPARSVDASILEKYDVILVDEFQRMKEPLVELLTRVFYEHKVNSIVFSFDYDQTLAKADYIREAHERLSELAGYSEFKLTDKIRTNKELYMFIRNMLKLTDTPNQPMEYPNVDVLYAGDSEECEKITAIMQKKGYTLLTYSEIEEAEGVNSPVLIEEPSEGGRAYSVHQVIGQEFDNVLLILDDNFRYNEAGELEGREDEESSYYFAKLFFQNITRVREKLAILVKGNRDLFRSVLNIKN